MEALASKTENKGDVKMTKKYIIEDMQEEYSNLTWSNKEQSYIETPKDVVDFLKGFEDLCRKHKITLSHEDSQGSFEIEPFDEDSIRWICNAADTRG